MCRAVVAVCLVLQAARAFAEPTLVATGRIGVAHSEIIEEQVDGSRQGVGGSFGAELGLALDAIHLQPSIAIDLGQVSATNAGDGVFGDFTMRERTVAITARLRVNITDFFDVFGGVGETGLYEHRTASRHTWGQHTQLGCGVRVWSDHLQAVRIEVMVNKMYTAPEGDDLTLFQYGASVSYSRRLP